MLIRSRIAPYAFAVALLTVGASVAEAGWSRSGGGTGPRGNSWNSSGSGSCSGGTCSSQQSVNGPRGTTTRSGTTSCSGGTCTGTRTITGPAGNSATRSGSVTRY